jgi:Flp pilus assembly protein TadD
MRGPSAFWILIAAGFLSACATAPELNGLASADGDQVPLASGDAPTRQSASGNGTPEGLLRLAADMESHGQKDVALSVYKRAVTVSGETSNAYVQFGDACQRAGKLDEAVGAYREALGKSPDDATALLGIGTVLVRQGKPEEALDPLVKAAPTVNTAAAYDRLGVAQTLVGAFPEAEASFDKAATLAPDDLDIRTNGALAAALAGHDDTAVATMRDVVKSQAAELRHQRDFIIVLGLIGRGAEAPGAVSSRVSRNELRRLLARAGSIRAMASPKARAQALGTITG